MKMVLIVTSVMNDDWAELVAKVFKVFLAERVRFQWCGCHGFLDSR